MRWRPCAHGAARPREWSFGETWIPGDRRSQHGDRPRAARARGATGERWLRLYAWGPHCLSFGRHEPARPAVRSSDASSARDSMSCGGRPAGGRCGTRESSPTPSPRRATRWAPSGGLPGDPPHARRRAPRARRRRPRCAEPRRPSGSTRAPASPSPAGGEVMVGGRKVVGSAQLARAARAAARLHPARRTTRRSSAP